MCIICALKCVKKKDLSGTRLWRRSSKRRRKTSRSWKRKWHSRTPRSRRSRRTRRQTRHNLIRKKVEKLLDACLHLWCMMHVQQYMLQHQMRSIFVSFCFRSPTHDDFLDLPDLCLSLFMLVPTIRTIQPHLWNILKHVAKFKIFK